MNDFVALLEKIGLTRAEAKSTASSFKGWGYGLTPAHTYQGTGNDLVQSDHQIHFLIERLLRKLTPLKRLDYEASIQVFRGLSQEGWRIVLPKTYPVVP